MPDAPEPELREAIAGPLRALTQRQTGLISDADYLVLVLQHPDTATVIGGLWAWTAFTQAHIELLFVPEELRGAGLGRRLMQQAEAEAIRRGCRHVWLDTYSFQAPGFYERLGYAEFGRIPDCIPGHDRVFLRKALAPTPAG